MMKRSVTCRLGASTATGMFCRQLLVKGNGTAPARGSVQRTGYTGKGETGSRSSMRPISISRSKILGQLTHNGRATASSVEVQRDVVGSSNKASGGGHASSPTSLTTSYPLMLHALDTYQPWMDAEAGEMVHPGPPAPIPGFGNRQAELLHLSNTGHTHTASTTIMHLAVNEKDRILDVRWADGHVSHFHMIWLRDHDYSDMNATNQRNTDTVSIPLDISSKEVRISGGGRYVRITWDKCVHGVNTSTFDTAWLRQHCYYHIQETRRTQQPRTQMWGSELVALLPSLAVAYADVMHSDAALLRLLRLVQRYGVAVVSGTPVDKDSSQQVVERVGPVRNTIYGGFWETRVMPAHDKKNIDSAFSTCALPAHTDGNYWRDPPGLQIFHCLEADPHGGDTLLVDGFQVANRLQRRDPAAFRLLSKTPVPFQHRDRHNHMVAYHTVIGSDSLGDVTRFSLNTLDRASLQLPPDEITSFYRAWKSMCEVVQTPANEAWFKMTPGNLIILNNRRVLHGRSVISGNSERVLCGCYVSYEDYTSKLSILEQKAALAAAAVAAAGVAAAGPMHSISSGRVW